MFKFLRKYNKMLLAVFGVLLMITFLIPEAFNQFSQRAAQQTGTVATVGEQETISAAEWRNYQQEVEALDRLTSVGVMQQLPGLGVIRDPQQWYLLVREATAANLTPVLEVRDASDQSVQQLMAVAGTRDPTLIRRVQEHYMGVLQLLNLYMTGDLYSDVRLRSDAERLMYGITAKTVIVQPDPDGSSLQPTGAQIEEQMKKYADKLAGEGEFGFGYKLPDRVKIEWITIPVASIRGLVENAPAMDRIEQFRHWKKGPSKPEVTFPPYPSDGAAADIPEVVRTDLLNQLLTRQSDDIAKFAADTLRLSRRGTPEKDGYLVLPENWETTQKTLPQLAEDLRTRFKIDLPAYQARGDAWLALSDLAALPGIGTATTDKISNTPVSLNDLVKAAKEFGGNPTILMQEGVPGPPLRDAEGNLYVFRIIDTDPTRQPTSVDEVREQVVKDLKRQDEYQKLKQELPALEAEARSNGLLAVALARDTIVQPPMSIGLWNEQTVNMLAQYGIPLSSQPSALPIIGADKDTVQAILDRARQSLPAGMPASQTTPEQRVFAAPSDNKLAVVIVDVTAQHPLTRESFDRLVSSGAIQQIVAQEDADEQRSVDKAFSLEALVKRNNFKFQNADADADPDAGQDSGDAAAEPAKAASAG
jgi:hypothetical protein